jgi:chloramphenicol-sensitive protein RarD
MTKGPLMTTTSLSRTKHEGLAMGLLAYGLWGIFPLYWPLLRRASAFEILGHRVVWSLLFSVLLLVVARQWMTLKLTTTRQYLLLGVASLLVGLNWWLYIWAVNAGRVVETALGYFINPLVSVVFGVVLLGERLRRLQWIAVGIAATGVLWLTFALNRAPLIALALALSFGLYGLLKKKAQVAAVPALLIETAFLLPLALCYLTFLAVQHRSTFAQHGSIHALLLVSTGLVTALPLLAFAGAVARIPLSSVGLLQYLAPSMQFLIGVFVRGEEMGSVRWVGFGLVWVALLCFGVDLVQSTRLSKPIAAVSKF